MELRIAVPLRRPGKIRRGVRGAVRMLCQRLLRAPLRCLMLLLERIVLFMLIAIAVLWSRRVIALPRVLRRRRRGWSLVSPQCSGLISALKIVLAEMREGPRLKRPSPLLQLRQSLRRRRLRRRRRSKLRR